MKRPNIILILTDHFRRDTLGPDTPNLMKIAKNGTRFTNAYSSSPLCQPARNCIITGMLPAETGICGNQNAPIDSNMRAETYMRKLQESGYYTALIGKHHYIDRWGMEMDVCEDEDEVKEYGFDRVIQVVDDGENFHNKDNYTSYLQENGLYDHFMEYVRDCSVWHGGKHAFEDPDVTADGFIGLQGVEFIKKYDKEQPFYLNLSFVGPHPPFWCPDDLEVSPKDMPLPLDGPDDLSSTSKRAHYLQKCKLIDRYIGKLADALKERGIYDDTVIIFTGDHGDCLGDHNIWGKRFFYESSVGIPFIVAGPGVVSEERQNGNRVSKLLVTQLDIYPTVLRLASVKVQNDRRRIGEDLIAMLNQERNHFRDEIFSELGTAVMIHTGNWKMVYDPEQGGVRYLFNMATDPDEMQNLAGHSGYNEIANQLIERILRSKILRSNFTHIKEESRLQQHRRI